LEKPKRRPCVVLIGGLPGTGKSTLARSLAEHAGFDLIRSDVVRKELVGGADGPARQKVRGDSESGIYSPEWTERTYEECLDRASAALFEGRRVVVDATFRAESHRRWFLDLAAEWGVPATFLICQVDPAVAKARLEHRRNDVSDADWKIYLKAMETWEPISSKTQTLCRMIDSGQGDSPPFSQALYALRQLELWE
jgi:predicted kinase